MAKFIAMKDAAAQLGVSSEELNEMRERGEIHGYRDGTTWKFKDDEVTRVLEERKSGGGGDDFGPLSLDDEIHLADEGSEMSDESILVSEEELGHSGETTSSTIIGKMAAAGQAAADDSDLKLQSASSALTFVPGAKGSEMKLVSDNASDLQLSSDNIHDSDVALVPGSAADSDVSLIPTGKTDLKLGKSSKADKSDVLGGSDLQLKTPSSGGTGIQRASDLGGGSSDLDLHLDSGLALADDDDLVLGGSGIGSDVTMAGDSGINLSSPTDSGLSLEEEPLDLTGGSAVSSLELPEDDALTLEDNGDQMVDFKQDEEFLLSPSGDAMSDDADSGSQVIALEESSGGFDLGAAGLGAGGFGASGLGPQLMEAAPSVAPADAGFGGIAPAPGTVPVGAGIPYEAPEAPYTILQIISLLSVLLVLGLSGMLMMDVVRNMWSWDKSSSAATSISDGIAGFLK